MKNYFSLFIKRPIHAFLRRLDEIKFRRRLTKKILKVPDKGIYLSYAGQSKPNADGVIHGGRVKLIHLAEIYPEVSTHTNLLYLVSSAIPKHAELMVQCLKAKGVKLVWNQNGVAYPAWDSVNYKQTNSKLSLLLHMADYVVYQSVFCRESANRYLGKAEVPNKVIYNPVDTEVFTPPDNPPSQDVWQLLITGTHLQPDRVMLILKVMAELKCRGQKANLVVAGRLGWPGGEKETREEIKKLMLTDCVLLTGSYTQAVAPGIYQAAHILIHIKYKDPCPTVPIEAMSCGLPVVGSRSGGMPELVSDDSGVLLEVPDVWDRMCYPAVDEVVDAVYCIMRNLDRWSIKARERAVNCFSKDHWLEQHHQIFTKLI